MDPTHSQSDVVLLGAGHTHVQILRKWRTRPWPGAGLTCVSNFPVTTYSGMLPGTLAGLYRSEQMEIDAARLCAESGVKFVCDNVVGVDVADRRLLFADRTAIRFDVLSIGIGSVPRQDDVEIVDGSVIAVKPMQTFLARLEERLEALRRGQVDRRLKIAVVGGGAAGIEIAFCLDARLRRHGAGAHNLTVVDASDDAGHGMTPRTRSLVRRELASRGIALRLCQPVIRVARDSIELADGEHIASDLTLWATGASPPALLAGLNLPKDEAGFLLTGADLRSVCGAPVFAVGDSGSIEGLDLAKAGVYAVRQGPILWNNIARQLSGKPLVDFRPQRDFLKLLATGDGRAIISYKSLAFHARWCWRLKDWIDRRFVGQYQFAETSRRG